MNAGLNSPNPSLDLGSVRALASALQAPRFHLDNVEGLFVDVTKRIRGVLGWMNGQLP